MDSIFTGDNPVKKPDTTPLTFELLEFAKSQLRKLYSGEVFLLSGLFYGYEWNRLPKQDRILLGRNFLEYAKGEEGKKLVEILGKSIRHQQQYSRK